MGSNQNKARVLNLNTFSKKKGKNKLYQLKNVLNTQSKRKEGRREKEEQEMQFNVFILHFGQNL